MQKGHHSSIELRTQPLTCPSRGGSISSLMVLFSLSLFNSIPHRSFSNPWLEEFVGLATSPLFPELSRETRAEMRSRDFRKSSRRKNSPSDSAATTTRPGHDSDFHLEYCWASQIALPSPHERSLPFEEATGVGQDRPAVAPHRVPDPSRALPPIRRPVRATEQPPFRFLA